MGIGLSELSDCKTFAATWYSGWEKTGFEAKCILEDVEKVCTMN